MRVNYDITKNQSNKEIEIVDYDVSNKVLFAKTTESPVIIPTNINFAVTSEYIFDIDEKDLEFFYNQKTNLVGTTTVVVLQKSLLSKRKGTDFFTFNFLISDSIGSVIKCIHFNAHEDCEMFNIIKPGCFYNLTLNKASLSSTKAANTTFDVAIALSSSTTVFTPTTKQFQIPEINFNYLYLSSADQFVREDVVDVMGIICRIDAVTNSINIKLNVSTSRRIIYLTDGKATLPVYLHGELAYSSFELRQVLGIINARVKSHPSCKTILTCGKSSYAIVLDDIESAEFKKAAGDYKEEDLYIPELSSIPTIDEILQDGKFLIHVRNLPPFQMAPYKFYTFGKISNFGNILFPTNENSVVGPYMRIDIYDTIITMQSITIFINKMGSIAPFLHEESAILGSNTDMNEKLGHLLHKPMVFRIKLDNYVLKGPNGQIYSNKSNKLIDYIEEISSLTYDSWVQNMTTDMIKLIKDKEYRTNDDGVLDDNDSIF
uniref:CPSF_A domain-containing protein n=1 Tax=Parastrongyloides trichosuri TaxID=131310 RepID=A0A0N5A033_PARTI